MKSALKRALLGLTGVLLAGTAAQAQEISTSLPLTSIGDRLMWAVGDQNLNLDVPMAGKVRLELYSPRIDPADYPADRKVTDQYFGDEYYAGGENAVTTFTLVDGSGKTVLSRSYTPGQHNWETLFDQELPAGKYRLQVQTTGNAKNTFAVRLAGVSAAISAERLTVNVHSQSWTPALNVTTDGQPYVLRMYDGDGPSELEARLRDSAGNIYPLSVSGDLAWADLPLPEPAGQYTVELRQTKEAKQFSNTVSFGLTRQGNEAPITLSKVDQTGTLRVTAELLLPTGNVPTQADVNVAAQRLHVDGEAVQTVAAGDYALSAVPQTGAEVNIDHTTVNVPKGGEGVAHVQVRPQVQLDLSSDKREVCVGDTVQLTARASTAYTGQLPMDLLLDAPGLSFEGQNTLQGTLSAEQPGLVQLTAKATTPGPVTVSAKLSPWEKAQTLDLLVRPDVTSLQLSRADLADARYGDEVVVKLTVKNTASAAVDYTLTDQPTDGLQALESTSFSGTLAAGESREVSYRAKVTAEKPGDLKLNATLNTLACPAPQQVGGTLNVTERPAPAASRRSTITLPFDAPRETKTVVIAHQLPAGATYVPGSTKMDGKTVAEPLRGPSGMYYWEVPVPTNTGNETEKGAALRGLLTYDVAHSAALPALNPPSLSVQLPGQRSEILEGNFDTKDYALAKPLKAEVAVLTENDGAVKLPLAGSVIRIRDRITVTVEGPQGQTPDLTVNGKPVSADLIGTNTQDSGRGIQRLTYVGVPIVNGPNVLRFNGQEITVNKVGATEKVELVPLSLLADGSTPIKFKVRTLDAYGQLTDQPTVTLSSNLEVRTPDANTSESGYQVKLTEGEGIVEFQPQTSPATLKISVLNNNEVVKYSYEIKPDQSRVGIGQVSATVGLNGNFSLQNNLTWQARGYYEGPLAGGKLYIAADKDKLPTDENPLIRYPVYGDASVETVPLQGIDPVALTYDHPAFRAEYRRNNLPIDVLPLGERFTAFTAFSKSNPQISGFAALVPNDRKNNVLVELRGARLLHLSDLNLSEGSESLVLVTLEHGTGKLLKQATLVRNVDYTIDYLGGLVILSKALDRIDPDMNEQRIYASYRLENPMAQRKLSYGVQVKKTGDNYTIGAAAVSLDSNVTFGARATYDNGITRADGLLAYSGGVQASLSVDTVPNDRQSFSVHARYQQPGYHGLGKFGDGTRIDASANFKVTPRLRAVVDAEYHNIPPAQVGAIDPLLNLTDPVLNLNQPDSARGGSVAARAEYDFKPFSVGLGAKYAFGDIYGIGAVGSVGYHTERLNVDVVHTQPLTGNLPTTTDITTRFGVARNVTLGFTDKITWGLGQAAALTLDSVVGNVNYALGYELPTASGAGNRARFSVGTTLALNKNLALGLHGAALYSVVDKSGEVGAGADLNYKTDNVSATVGGDVNYNKQGFGVVLRGGITGTITDHLTLTADGLAEYGQGRNGQRFSLGYGYRNRTLVSLGYLRYMNGSLAPVAPVVEGGISAEYRQPYWAVRAGAEARKYLNDKDSFVWQGYVGGTAYLNEWFGVGAWGGILQQPALKSTVYGYGLEASVRPLPGTWLTAGYNIKGFDNLPSAYAYTKPGFYVRLDMILDETLGKQR